MEKRRERREKRGKKRNNANIMVREETNKQKE